MFKKLLIIFLFFNLIFVWATGAFADSEESETIWIEPGVSIGTMRLGLKLEDVISREGIPKKIIDKKYWEYYQYPSIDVQIGRGSKIMSMLKSKYKDMLQRGKYELSEKEKAENKKEFDKIEYEVEAITTYSPLAKTRGNLSIGSSLKEVMDVFGPPNVQVDIEQDPIMMIMCSRIRSYRYPEKDGRLREGIFSGYVLEITYFVEGIEFHFKLAGDNSSVTVFAISVMERSECSHFSPVTK